MEDTRIGYVEAAKMSLLPMLLKFASSQKNQTPGLLLLCITKPRALISYYGLIMTIMALMKLYYTLRVLTLDKERVKIQ
ncbi:hypothetical membrane protein [Candidatus Protochlamydia naegleriophila]|uniref:Hypothetical membrane protein n=1 Tax=Candidatus Protochlamydia naegleriophila TaxID=389348 RepID=A0A0U5JC55_9BACT|nr:hypothetical membrane protein [Candidatus Protochlamydia naegleriophila]